MPFDTDLADQALRIAIAFIQAKQAGDVSYGRRSRSAGCLVTHPSFAARWLKVKWLPSGEMNRFVWDGELLSICLEGIDKPRIFAHFDWEAIGICHRAILMSVARGIICKMPRLDHVPALEPGWWEKLEDALAKLEAKPTDRTHVVDEQVAHQLRQRFGLKLKVPLPAWQTAHGDLHWANLTAPEFSILDWETWGRAPFGYDVANLHIFTLMQPEVLGRLKQVFAPVMARPEYDIALLFLAAEMMWMFDLHGGYPRLQPDLHREAARVLEERRILQFCG